jgi:hypothetical protein
MKIAQYFSHSFQEECRNEKKLYSGNQDSKKLVGLRLKRLDATVALEFTSEDKLNEMKKLLMDSRSPSIAPQHPSLYNTSHGAAYHTGSGVRY